MSLILQNFRVLLLKKSLKPACSCQFSSKAPSTKILKEVDPNTGEVKSKKSPIIPKITLLSGDEVTVTTLPEAEKLSKRRDLRLVKIVDTDAKTQRPVYRMMTGSEYFAEDLKQREKRKSERQNIKGEKVLLINSKIAQHDLDTQLKKASQWIKKMYEVRVIISGAGAGVESSEKVYSSIEDRFKNEEARIVQKRTKGSDIKFQILPPKEKERHANL